MFRSLDKWLLPWLQRRRALAGVRSEGTQHVFLAVCDHFEPLHHTDDAGAMERLQRWRAEYPKLAAEFRDSSGRGPRHTFFYPVEQWNDAHVSVIREICEKTGSEIEVQLHHDGDTESSLRAKLTEGLSRLERAGCLARDSEGRARFGFVHGNWSLCNSRPDGRWCGVPHEIRILRDLGCYADFTFPSAPSDTQPRSVNQIGYARECGSARALDHLTAAALGRSAEPRHSADHLLLVQGPLALNGSRRKWGVLPRLENADLTAANPPTPLRCALWMRQHIHVAGKPDWLFIKLHSHGAVPANSDALLGGPMRSFLHHFTGALTHDSGVATHFVTAREMVNLIHAAEDDTKLTPEEACLDYMLRPARS